MPDQTNPTSGQGDGTTTLVLPVPPVIPSGEEIYDQLMQDIEPDLMTATLPTLKEKYKDETPEQAKTRAERYSTAFAEYDKQYAAYIAEQENVLHSYSRQLGNQAEQFVRTDEDQSITQLEAAISDI